MSRLGLFWTKRDIFGAWVRFKSCSGVYSYVLTSPTVYWIHKSPLSKLFEIFWRQTNRQTDGHTKPPLKITCHRLKSVFDLNLVIKLSFVHLLGLSGNSYHSGFFWKKKLWFLISDRITISIILLWLSETNIGVLISVIVSGFL